MKLVIKDLVQLVSLTVASIGGLIAAFKAIDEMKRNREQRVRELNWKQAIRWTELFKEMQSDRFSRDAMLMLEWTGRVYEIEQNPAERINFQDVWSALGIGDISFSKKDAFIRQCFDHLFESFSPIERYLEIELINFNDVDAYLGHLIESIAQERQCVQAYLDFYNYRLARKFLSRFDAWTKIA